jgi:hypothetical protein
LAKATNNGYSSAIYPGNNYPSNPLDLSAEMPSIERVRGTSQD